MVHRVYVIWDRLAKDSGPIFQAVNDEVAGRNYLGLLSKVAPWDRDGYELYCVGIYDLENRHLSGFEIPELIDVNVPNFEDIKQRSFDFEEEAKNAR